jgi:tetratricopeptide (TPR) repeat protein
MAILAVMTKPDIAIATSIPPGLSRLDRGRAAGADYQKLCVQSWRDCGFRVLSLNAPDEIPALAAAHPQVTFVPAGRVSERKTPFIADMLAALIAAPERGLGIVNADILFEPASAWNEIPQLVSRAVIAIQRHDTTALQDGALRRYYWGYDCFFFGRETAEDAIGGAGDFAMGLPWWDYWFPAAAMLKGREVRLLERPLTLHLSHMQGYRDATLHRYARSFAAAVLEGAGARTLQPELAALLPICRELIALDAPSGSTAEDRTLSDSFAHQIVPWHDALAANAIRLGHGGPSSAPAFQRLEDRLWAGGAYESARYHGLLGKSEEEGRMYRAALEKTPEDFETLLGYGAALCRGRNSGQALILLKRAAAQQPESPRVLNTIGFALRQTGKREEAVSCFERALRLDPDLREAAFNLAVTLFEQGRVDEAIACAEAVLIKWPDAAELQDLRRHLSATPNPSNPR